MTSRLPLAAGAALLAAFAASAPASAKAPSKLTGKVKKVSAAKGGLALKVRKDGRSAVVTLKVADGAVIAAGDVNGDGSRDLLDVQAGDKVSVRIDKGLVSGLVDHTTVKGDLGGSVLPGTGLPGAGEGAKVKGVPVRGQVASFDVQGGVLKLAAGREGRFAGQVLTVSVPQDTVVIVPDGNGDKRHDAADLKAGDYVVAVLQAPATDPDALTAIALVEIPGAGEVKPPKPPSPLIHGEGKFVSFDAVTGQAVISTESGSAQKALQTNAETLVVAPDANGDGRHDFADLKAGDKVHVIAVPQGDGVPPLLRTLIAEPGARPDGDSPKPPLPPKPENPGPGTLPAPLIGIPGTLVAKPDGGRIRVRLLGEGALPVITFTVSDATKLFTGDRTGDGARNWDDFNVGDRVGVQTQAPFKTDGTAPALAVGNMSFPGGDAK